MQTNSLRILTDRLEEMNEFELVVTYEQYQRYKTQGDTTEQPIRELLDEQINSGMGLCPELTVSSAITDEMAKRWYEQHR